MPPSASIPAVITASVRKLIQAARSGDEPAPALAALCDQVERTHAQGIEEAIRRELGRIDWEGRGRQPGDAFWTAPETTVSWLDQCHPNGFIREQAVRSLPQSAPNELFLSLALQRLNDWVPEVRAVARARVAGIAAASGPDIVAGALWQVLPRSADWGRRQPDDRQIMLDMLALEPVAPLVYSMLGTSVTGQASRFLTQALGTPATDPWLDSLATGATQPVVRAIAYRCLLAGCTTWIVGQQWVWTDVRWCEGQYQPVYQQRPLRVER